MKNLALAFIGVSSGFTVAAALFALIATIGVLNRLAQLTHSASLIRWYEVCFMAGGIIGNLLWIYQWHIPVGLSWEMGIFGLFMGIYVGCFIGALAEVVKVFPILFHRLRLREGMKAFIWAIALGKAVGGIIAVFQAGGHRQCGHGGGMAAGHSAVPCKPLPVDGAVHRQIDKEFQDLRRGPGQQRIHQQVVAENIRKHRYTPIM